jgi:hypothetical protein
LLYILYEIGVSILQFLKKLYPKQIHVTCVAHGLHRVCEKIRDVNPELDSFIANMKKVFIKAPDRINQFREMCPDIPLPPSPVVTRWETWINATLYYQNYWTEIIGIIDTLDEKEAVSIQKVKVLITDADVERQLIKVASNFGFLVGTLNALQKSNAQLKDALKLVDDVIIKFGQLGNEFPIPKEKLDLVLQKNQEYLQLNQITKFLNENGSKPIQCELSACELAALKYAPIISTAVERTFSMYNSFMRDNRSSFTDENLVTMFFIYCNVHM